MLKFRMLDGTFVEGPDYKTAKKKYDEAHKPIVPGPLRAPVLAPPLVVIVTAVLTPKE